MVVRWRHIVRLVTALAGLVTTPPGVSSPVQAKEMPGDTIPESYYYELETIPLPPDVLLEVGGLAFTAENRLGISTRRGEVWILENPYCKPPEVPVFRKFAAGLHEPLGLQAVPGGFLLAQRGELTRLEDTNGDGVADRFMKVYDWPLSGNYHEYSYGPVRDKKGNLLVTLNLSWTGKGASLAKWRGWLLEITPAGRMTPLATGLRSPAGFGFNADGDFFYTENQGDWVGAGRMTHLKKGAFAGNPAGLRWAGEKNSPVKLRVDDVPDSGRPMHEIAASVPGLTLPAVWFPHGVMGVSTSDIVPDTSGGNFGPFSGQLFVGDQGHSTIMRVFLEKIDGAYQGACFPFRKGFSSGVLRMRWGADHSLFVGMTNRGWSSTGSEPYGLQRLRWTGRTPFEIRAIRAQPGGFLLEFTGPVDSLSASDPASYDITGFTYHYWSKYGSKVMDSRPCMIHDVKVSGDHRSVRLHVHGLRAGYIHEVKAAGVRSREGLKLLHDRGYYTLNRIPPGKPAPVTATPAVQASLPESAASRKRITEMPSSWESGPDTTVAVGTKPGLQFDIPEIRLKARSRVALTFHNNDDMLHNLVITRPGDAVEKVGELAMELGLRGPDYHYVPATDLVLFHTGILAPETSEKIYFTAPDVPGVYTYVCTFPGHSTVMRGKLIIGL